MAHAQLPRTCKSCNKRRHPSETAALDAATLLMSQGNGRLGVYHCPKGNGWHLTSKPRAIPAHGKK